MIYSNFIGLSITVVWAFVICYVSGLRGFHALDQSIVFDSAWRVFQGQQPYLDFLVPFGPMSIWLQAAAFNVFGVTYRVYVITAAILNSIGSGAAYYVMLSMSPRRSWLALLTGVITSSWLYAPMGTTYPEQTGFVIVIGALFLAIRGVQNENGYFRFACMLSVGILVGSATLCKTNVGLFASPLLLLLIAYLKKRSLHIVLIDVLVAGGGITLVFVVFAVWLWLFSDPLGFRYSVIDVAGQEGLARLFGAGFLRVLLGLVTGKGNDAVRIIILASATVLILGLRVSYAISCGEKADRLKRLAIFGLSLIAFQHLFSLSSRNNGVNELPFIGMILAFMVESLYIVAEVKDIEQIQKLQYRVRKFIPLLLGVAVLFTVVLLPEHKNVDLLAGVVLGLLITLLCKWWLCKERTKREEVNVYSPVVWVMLIATFSIGARSSYSRSVQEMFNSQTQFIAHNDIPILDGLSWGKQATQSRSYANWEDLVAVWQAVNRSNGRFFIFGDHTLLYALTQKISVGPLVWLHKSLTYPLKYDVTLDKRIVTDLNRTDVSLIIVEKHKERNLGDFPLLENMIKNHYKLIEEYGIFKVYHIFS